MSTLSRLQAVTAQRAEANGAWERLIGRALEEGHSLRVVALAAGVSHVAIAKKRAKASR